MHEKIMFRTQVIASLRRRMIELGFTEFQTPILTSSSPEGARDYLVPSRLHPGKFYALPQAPQQFKQLLMVSGFDRYFQIAPCFRDEDARADRSPGEFYQLDLEMSFVEQDDVFQAVETVMYGVFTEFSQHQITSAPFPRLTYRDSMLRYGNDKPDLRFGLEIQDVSEIFGRSSFRIFRSAVENGSVVRMIAVPNVGERPRSFFDGLERTIKELGGRGLAWMVVTEEGGRGSIASAVSKETL
jgi:aspartyl-tRNA synthetase